MLKIANSSGYFTSKLVHVRDASTLMHFQKVPFFHFAENVASSVFKPTLPFLAMWISQCIS